VVFVAAFFVGAAFFSGAFFAAGAAFFTGAFVAGAFFAAGAAFFAGAFFAGATFFAVVFFTGALVATGAFVAAPEAPVVAAAGPRLATTLRAAEAALPANDRVVVRAMGSLPDTRARTRDGRGWR
jgi:hypothetical protein